MERQEVLQQKLENWCAASVRALSGDPSIHYRGHYLIRNEQPFQLQAPYLNLDFSTHNNRELRGIADSIALRLGFSDHDLHKALKPESPLEGLIFELLEQLRCESLAPNIFPGMRKNVTQRFLFWAHSNASSPLTENDVGLLIFTVNVMCWSRLLRHQIPEQIEDLIEHTRWGLADAMGKHMRFFTQVTHDQAAFAKHSLAIAKIIQNMIEEQHKEEGGEEKLKTSLKSLENTKQLNLDWLEPDNSVLQQNFGVSRADDIGFSHKQHEYTVFTRAYDVEVRANNVIRQAQLSKFRHELDKRVRQQSVNTHKVARYLKQLMSSPALSGWSFGEEEGHLDSARLSRLVTSPNDHKLFKQEAQQPKSDCLVSIVMDNSGSMTHHNQAMAAMVDIFAKALELAGITTEVLGFTTNEWNGGRVQKEWARAGKPDNPGRLNSIRHTIYKSADTPWRRARPAIAGLLRSDLFKEGFDGEALEWAVKRIEHRQEKKKIILMISDGSPMDTATHATNNARYLDHHLTYIANQVEHRPDIKLCGLGIGLDLSTYYRESMSISLQNELTTQDFMAMSDLLTRAV